jgi:hypothetical protein
MSIPALLFSFATFFFINNVALAASPSLQETALQYTNYIVRANEPFEVVVVAESDMCNNVAVVGDFAHVASIDNTAIMSGQVWLVQFFTISTLIGCGKPGTRTQRSTQTLKLEPKAGGESYNFIVPNSLKIEFKK